jgi:hypothetical protein
MSLASAHVSPGNGHVLRVSVSARAELGTPLGEIGLQRRVPVLVLVSGADGMDAETVAHLEHLFTHAIAPIADALGAYVVDGGTDAEVIGLMGRARGAISAGFSLVGGAQKRSDARPAGGRAPRLEPHHSPRGAGARGALGGSPALAEPGGRGARGRHASMTLLVNGGDMAWDGRPLNVVAGSGRAADALAAALARTQPLGHAPLLRLPDTLRYGSRPSTRLGGSIEHHARQLKLCDHSPTGSTLAGPSCRSHRRIRCENRTIEFRTLRP